MSSSIAVEQIHHWVENLKATEKAAMNQSQKQKL
jgi:hypothetical protein